ncbi:MAG: neutral/alkaline non-lysosomal ceramidase N-terminal domain-containing protein [Chitinophagales bacterium]
MNATMSFKLKKELYLIILVQKILFTGISNAQNTSAGHYAKIGVSQMNITPDLPVMMSGYDARKTPSTGIHDSLFASALFFTNDQEKALLITADIIGFPHLFVDTVKHLISEKTGIAADRIMLVALHNHGGPAIHAYEPVLPEANEVYIRTLKEKLLTLASNAAKSPIPFTMGIGKGVCTLNINRRAVFADGGVWLGRNPDGACDHELDIIKFADEKNQLIAVLVNWPCHGTASGQENYLITGDWPAAAARYIRKFAGKDIVVAVSAGASANINPIYGPGNDFSEVEAVGYHVAREAWKVFDKIKTAPVQSIKFSNSVLSYPGKKMWKDRFPEDCVGSGSDVKIRLSALKLENIVFMGVSGELMTEMGLQIKKASFYPHTIVLSHCNGLSGYICTDKAFTEGGYEPKVSHLMPGVEKPLLEKCLEMISGL